MAKATIKRWLRTDKQLKDGTAPIFLIYQISGQRKYLNTGIKVRPDNWENDYQQAIYLDKRTAKRLLPNVDYALLPLAKDIDNINDALDNILSEIKAIEARFSLDKITYSAEMVIEAYNNSRNPTTKKTEPKNYIADFLGRYIDDNRNAKRHKTICNYINIRFHLTEFDNKLTFENLTIAKLKSFQSFLLDKQGLSSATIVKLFSILKTALKSARIDYKINVNAEYLDFVPSVKRDREIEVIALTQTELQSIIDLDLSDKRKFVITEKEVHGESKRFKLTYKTLDKIREVFLFSCATGLRFSDLKDLKREHIQGMTIKKICVKTGQSLQIPLNALSYGILDKYKDLHNPLPIISGQKSNEYLKALGKLANINTPIEKVRNYGANMERETLPKYDLMTMHVGRKTFTTLLLEKGIASQEVMTLTGHTTYKSFARYVKVTDERKQAAMIKAFGKPENLKVVGNA